MMTKRAQRCRRHRCKNFRRFGIPKMKAAASRRERRAARQMLVSGEEPDRPAAKPVTAWDIC